MIEGTIVKVLKHVGGGLPEGTIGTVVKPKYADGAFISVAVEYPVEGHEAGYKFLLKDDELEIMDPGFEEEEVDMSVPLEGCDCEACLGRESEETIGEVDLEEFTTQFEITHGHPRFNTIVDQIKVLHSDKNFDYARGGDPLGNFKRVGDMLGTSAAEVAHAYMLKQVDAVSWGYRQGGESKVEGKIAKLRDIAVYSVLQMIMLEEEDGDGY